MSEAFYVRVFGFEVVERLDGEGFVEAVLARAGMVLCLQSHHANAGEAFTPTRTGLDHVAFRVDDRAELDAWQTRLAELGVRHSPVVERHYGAVLCARDPDDIQLEISTALATPERDLPWTRDSLDCSAARCRSSSPDPALAASPRPSPPSVAAAPQVTGGTVGAVTTRGRDRV